ncbi:MAG TPA: DUF2207 domain-containing protein [Dokdonella sp.]|uniref:DUF2207 domain-containing protein n=1 Tax=Dokdonella sp. TaxID=2291710 RepID=UPI0025BB0321|nr:DUF2207 domain-containing protein [Dokdonella sp.]MBX3691346.1 DUF2207 domain-containing protein [Dokdonella sp.]MCW5568036.1 DUF2207 domain-containing protein [Dokdonella sp.]HNR90957.1 DUF2207 domain-containing protein [Dokdonella sp.]
MTRWLIGILLLCTVTFTRADERILEYHSDIAIAADSTMIVAETIRVNAEGNRIRRGIYRDFPTAYRDRNGRRVNVSFEPLEVSRNGAPEPWRAEPFANGVRVYFGDPEVFLQPGEHTYVFRYRTARQLGFFKEHDELYWNVTGNGWDFNINRASATVSLPGDGARGRLKVEAYTGEQGSTARDATAGVDSEGNAVVATRNVLPPYHGLTLVAMFPKGIVGEPSLADQARWFSRDNRREAILLGGLVVLVLFLFLQWRRLGRDPEKGVIFPQYDPPHRISPAVMRFVRRMEYDDRCFAADVVLLGVHGALEIAQQGRTYVLRKRAAPGPELPDSAKSLYTNLFRQGAELVLKQSDHERIGGIRSEHRNFINDKYAKDNFRRNDGIGCFGVLFTIAVVTAALLLDSLDPTVELIILTIVTGLLAMVTAGLIMGMIAAHEEGTGIVAKSIWAVLVAAVTAATGYFLSMWSSVIFAVLVAAICASQVPFGFLMRAPTVAGRKLLDQFDGLRLYLGVAERDELARAKEPPMTMDEYQRLLPYAMALEVEKTWGDRLAAVMGASAAAAAGAAMAWYHGSSGRGFDAGSFGSSLNSSLSSAISSSSTPPGSSSGGGGGGSSGGGGGGGGGGGW